MMDATRLEQAWETAFTLQRCLSSLSAWSANDDPRSVGEEKHIADLKATVGEKLALLNELLAEAEVKT